MDRTVDTSKVGWTPQVIQGLVSTLMEVCDELPKSEFNQDVKSQLRNINSIDPSSRMVKYAILDHLVGILNDLIPQVEKIYVTGEPCFQIVDHLMGIIMTLQSLSEKVSEKARLHRVLKKMLAQLMEISIIFEPVNEIRKHLDLVIGVLNDLMPYLQKMYVTEWQMVNGQVNKEDFEVSNVSKEVIFCHLLRIFQDKMSQLMGISHKREKQKDQIVELFIWILQKLTSLVTDDSMSGLRKSKIRDILIGMIKVLLLLLGNIPKNSMVNSKLKNMLSQLQNKSSLNPIAEIPENIRLLSEMDPKNVPTGLIMEHISQIQLYMRSLVESRTGPVIWVPRNLLLLFLYVIKTPNVQKYLESHIMMILDAGNETHIVDPVSVLIVHLDPLLSISETKLRFGVGETLTFVWNVFEDIQTELTNIYRRIWKDETLIGHIDTGEMLPECALLKSLHPQDLTISKIPKDVILDYLSRTIRKNFNNLSQVMFDCEGLLHKDHMVNTLVSALQRLTSTVMNECEHVSGITKNEIRDLLIGIMKALLSLLENISEMALVKRNLKDMLSHLVNKSSLNPVTEVPDNIQLLLEMDPKTVPINMVVYHLVEMYDYLRILFNSKSDQPIVWVPRNLLSISISVTKLLPWSLQKKLFSHIKKIMDSVPGQERDQTEDPVGVLRVDLVPLVIHVGKLIKVHLPLNANVIRDDANKAIIFQLPIIEWTRKTLNDLLLNLMNVCMMLPQNDIIQELQSQLVHILCCPDPLSWIPKNVFLDHLVAILQELLPWVKEFSGLQKNELLDTLYVIIKALLTLSMNISEMMPIHRILKNMLSEIVNISRVHLVREIWKNLAVLWPVFKDIYLKQVHICLTDWGCEIFMSHIEKDHMVHDPELFKDLQSQILSKLPKDRIVEYLLELLHEKLAMLSTVSDISSNQIIDTLFKVQEDLASQVIHGCVIGENHDVIWDHSVGIIWDNLSQVFEIDHVDGTPKTNMLDHLVGILQQMTSMVKDNCVHVSGIPTNEIRDLLSGMIKVLQSFLANASEKALTHLINGRLKVMLSQLVKTSSLNPVIKIPENIRHLLLTDPESVSVALVVDHISEIKEYLLSLTKSCRVPVVWIPRNLLLLFQHVTKVLPWNLKKMLQTHLKIIDPIPRIPNDKIQDSVSILPVDLLPLVTVMQFLTTIPKAEILDLPIYGQKDKCSVPKMEWTNEKVKDMLSELLDTCNMVPQNMLIQDVRSQVINILRCIETVSGIKMNVIVDHLVGILQDILSQVMEINLVDVTERPRKPILEHLHRITKTLLSLTLNICETTTINRILEDMLSFFTEISRMDPARKIRANMVIMQDVLNGIWPELKNRILLEWDRLRIEALIDVGQKPTDSDLHKYLEAVHKQDVLDFLNDVIQKVLLEVIGIQYVREIPKDQMLHHLLEILQQLTLYVMDEHVSEMPKSKIRDPLIWMIKALLSWLETTSKIGLMKRKLEDMLSQLLKKSSSNTVIEIPKNMQTLMEMDSEGLPLDLIVENLSKIKRHLELVTEARTIPIVWVPRKMLLLFLNMLNIESIIHQGIRKKLQSHMKKILNPVPGTLNQYLDPVSVLYVDLVPILKMMESLIEMPKNFILSKVNREIMDHILYHVSDMTKDELSQHVNISKMECATRNLADQLSHLMQLCNTLPETTITKDLSLEIERLYSSVPANGKPHQVFLDHLVVILLELIGQVMQIDPVRGIKKNVIFPKHTLEDITLVSPECIPKGLFKDHQVAHLHAEYQISQGGNSVNVHVIPKDQLLNDLIGIIKSLQSFSEMASVNGKLEDMLSCIKKCRMGDKVTMDPELKSLRDHGLQLMEVFEGLPEKVLPGDILPQLLYLCSLDHASQMPKTVIRDRLVAIHQDLSGLVDESIKSKLDDILSKFNTSMNITKIKPVSDLMLKLMSLMKLEPENEFLKDLHSRITNLLMTSKMDPAKIPAVQIIGVLFLLIRPESLNMHGITQGNIEEHFHAIGEDLTSILQNLNLVARISKNKQYSITNDHMRVDGNKMLTLPQQKLLRDLWSKGYFQSGNNDVTEKSDEVKQMIQDIKLQVKVVSQASMIPDHILTQITDESSFGWTKEAIKYLVTLFIDFCKIMPESELLKDVNLQLANISRINTEGGAIQEVTMDHLVGIIQDLLSQVIEDKRITEIHKNQILDDLTGITVCLLSLAGNISVKTPTYGTLRCMLSHLNDFRMDSGSKALKEQMLSLFEGLSKKQPEDLQGIEKANITPQDVVLDHLFMVFRYLMSVSSNVSKLTDIRAKVKHLLSQIVHIPRIDPVSGLPKDLLSLLVYCFFPASHMYWHPSTGSHQLMPHYIVKEARQLKNISTGSLPEYLHLPFKITEIMNVKSRLIPDTDRMIDTTWFQQCYDTMSLEINEAQPVFCKIKHGMASDTNLETGLWPGMLDGLYLSSAKVNYLFRSYQVHHPQYKRYDQETTRTDYDSASMVFTSAESWNSDSDTLFCIPVTWNEDYKQNFLRRLKKDKWPINSVAYLGKLLTEAVYAIPKPDPNSKDGDLRWRLSFSVVEVELARSLNDIQRRCYKVLKAMIKHFVNVGLSEHRQFPSYYLKTLMFWLCETTPEESWKIQWLGIQFLKLLDSVIESLEKNELFMYFIPTYNLLKDKDAGSISVWKERLRKIREDPLETFIKFWSAYEVETLRSENWGYCFNKCLIKLNETCNKTLVTREQQKYNEATYTCRWIVAKYLLATYSLNDFLNYVKIYPETNKLISGTKASSVEHLIWMYYNEFSSVGFLPYPEIQIPENYSNYWSYLAEVTHHMVLKYGQNVPDKDLFSKQTSERFHLIACSIQNKVEKINLEKYIKYANFLRGEKQHENAAHLLIFSKIFQRCFTNRFSTFSRITSEVLDTCMKLTVAFQEDVSAHDLIFSYHLLETCYKKAGVLAEVCFNEHEWRQAMPGFQFIMCEQLQKAFQSFASINDKLPDRTLSSCSHHIKYAAMFFIVAKLSVSTIHQN